MTTRAQYRLVDGAIKGHVHTQTGLHLVLLDLVEANIQGARRIAVPPPAVPCMAYVGGEPCEQPSTIGLIRPGVISALYLCPTCYRVMR